ncbi:ubiquitin-conjugating enzyme/RWD-like protein [Lipomyces arxii]|uniref:ubiquitin-conjugating enzyme/RWD-like protein n=1 Tax=Lipomyces arxii TaxID=56418 RepID=UPI0034CEBF53
MSLASTKRLAKEYRALEKEAENSTVIRDVDIAPVEEYDMFRWTGTIRGAPDTPYEGGVWKIDIKVPPTYPLQPPEIRFVTKICHPNIHFTTGEVCLDILKNHWTAAWTLQSACIAVLALLSDPEIDSPLNIDAANVLRFNDKPAYDSLVKYFAYKYAISKDGDT